MVARRAFLACLALAVSAGCASAAGTAPAPLQYRDAPPAEAQPYLHSTIGRYIKHVVILIQENRSFDNFFGGRNPYPGAETAVAGVAKTAGYGCTQGGYYPLVERRFEKQFDPSHGWYQSMADWDNGSMDGFNCEGLTNGGPSGSYPYSYTSRDQVRPYWDMAEQYVLADHYFPTQFGDSFSAHLNLIAGTDEIAPDLAEGDYPEPIDGGGCNNPDHGVASNVINTQRIQTTNGPFPCFNQFETIADTLEASSVPEPKWRWYEPPLGQTIWATFSYIGSVYGPPGPAPTSSQWDHVVSPPAKLLTDLAGSRRTLAAVTYVIAQDADTDHAGNGSDTGPSWVADVVNAIGESKFWKSTAIVVLWDECGGWYDHVPPPQLDFRGLGIRVPLLIVSPYAKRGFVSHTVFESASILKFIELAFDLPTLGSNGHACPRPNPLGYTECRATSLAGDDRASSPFDFSAPPRAFVPIKAKYPPSHFIDEPPDSRLPDND